VYWNTTIIDDCIISCVNLVDSHITKMPAAPAPKTRESKPREAKPKEAKPKEAKPKEAKEDKSKVHKLSLKGSSKLCVEFFEFAANTILFQRGVYPPEDFAP
jgi:hypothetical protein